MPSFRVLLITLFLSLPLAGCSSFNDLKNEVMKGVSQKQIEPAVLSKSSPRKVKPLRAPSLKTPAPSSKCSYIVRDLSVPNATAVWCMPRVSRR